MGLYKQYRLQKKLREATNKLHLGRNLDGIRSPKLSSQLIQIFGLIPKKKSKLLSFPIVKSTGSIPKYRSVSLNLNPVTTSSVKISPPPLAESFSIFPVHGKQQTKVRQVQVFLTQTLMLEQPLNTWPQGNQQSPGL